MESYKHKYAKEVLKDWLRYDFLRIDLEYKFVLDGRISFIPDIVCFDKNGINTIYEIVHKHEIDSKKLARMQFYFFISEVNIKIYEIQAEWVMRQIEKPKKLIYIDMSLPEMVF